MYAPWTIGPCYRGWKFTVVSYIWTGTWLFFKQIVQADNIINIKAPCYWYLVRGIQCRPVVFTSQMPSNVGNVSMLWQHHVFNTIYLILLDSISIRELTGFCCRLLYFHVIISQDIFTFVKSLVKSVGLCTYWTHIAAAELLQNLVNCDWDLKWNILVSILKELFGSKCWILVL